MLVSSAATSSGGSIIRLATPRAERGYMAVSGVLASVSRSGENSSQVWERRARGFSSDHVAGSALEGLSRSSDRRAHLCGRGAADVRAACDRAFQGEHALHVASHL